MYIFANAEQQEQWERMVVAPGSWFESKARVFYVKSGSGWSESSGTYYDYGQDNIREMSIRLRAFSGQQPSVGGCLAGELTLKLDGTGEQMIQGERKSIPRAARIDVYVRVCLENEVSVWLKQGRFFVDTRETTNDDDGLPVLSLHAYDAMLKAEADYGSSSLGFPRGVLPVVREIAQKMNLPNYSGSGGRVDPRTVTLLGSSTYTVPTTPVGYSLREVLSRIAAMFCGNWVINYDGQLLLVQINGMPVETNVLVTDVGARIVFGLSEVDGQLVEVGINV